jgi:hypothetical protein
VNTLREAWRAFFFRPTPTSTLAVVRIGYGLVILAWAASVGPDLMTFYAPDGMFSKQYIGWGILQFFNSHAAVVVVYALFIASAVALTLGYRTRIAAILVFVSLSSLFFRNPYLQSGGDALLRIIGFFLMFAPAGASLSLDRWRTNRARFWEFPSRSPWALRMIQIQLVLMYLATAYAKLNGETWRSGTAVGYALQLAHYERLPIPQAIVDSPLPNLMTWGTLVIEVLLPILIWNRRLRPWAIAAGVGLHLSIELTLKVGFFSWAVFVLYLAFIPADTLSGWVLRARARIRSRLSRDDAMSVRERSELEPA